MDDIVNLTKSYEEESRRKDIAVQQDFDDLVN